MKQLAESPIFDSGIAKQQVILRVEQYDGKVRKFVVHDQLFHPDGSITFSNGSYFDVIEFVNTEKEQLAKAMERFHERVMARIKIHNDMPVYDMHDDSEVVGMAVA